MQGDTIINTRNGKTIATRTDYANNWSARLIGLLSRLSFNQDEALWIIPCHAIHTMGMRFHIDVVFLNKENSILKIIENVKPNCFYVSCKGSDSVLELPIGTISMACLKVGDHVIVKV